MSLPLRRLTGLAECLSIECCPVQPLRQARRGEPARGELCVALAQTVSVQVRHAEVVRCEGMPPARTAFSKTRSSEAHQRSVGESLEAHQRPIGGPWAIKGPSAPARGLLESEACALDAAGAGGLRAGGVGLGLVLEEHLCRAVDALR